MAADMDLRQAGYTGCQNKMGRGQVERFDWLTLTPGSGACQSAKAQWLFTRRTGSHILARNIRIAAWLPNPVLPIEALTQNLEILIQRCLSFDCRRSDEKLR